MRTTRLLSAALVAGVFACGGDSGGPSENNNGGAPAGDIIVGNNFFDPAAFTADIGGEVVWAWNSGGTVHDIVFEDGAPGSGERSSGTFSRTFGSAGEYPYFCSIHGAALMSGVVNVASADDAGPSEGGDEPPAPPPPPPPPPGDPYVRGSGR